MKIVRPKWLFSVPILVILALLIFPFRSFVADVFADQTSSSRANATLTLARSVTNSTGDGVQSSITRGEMYTLQYIITPQPVASNTTPVDQHKLVTDLRFSEKLPPNLEVSAQSLPTGFTLSGSITNGYTLNGSLPDIMYTWNEGQHSFIADHSNTETHKIITISIPFQATVSGDYIFNKANLTYTDIHTAGNTPVSTPNPGSTTSPKPNPGATFDPSVSGSNSALGVAGDYAFFALGDALVSGTSFNGNLASGGNTTVDGVSISESGKPYSIVTRGNFNFTNGYISGNVVYGGAYNPSQSGGINGQAEHKSPDDLRTIIDFDATNSYLLAKSAELRALPINGKASLGQYNKDQVTLTGTDPKLNVFLLNSSTLGVQFSTIKGIDIKVPANSATIINIDDPSVVMDMWGEYEASQMIFNFPQATNLTLTGRRLGTYLAPLAAVTANGSLKGSVIAGSLKIEGIGFESASFIPPIPAPAPTATPAPTTTPTITISFPGLTTVTAVEPVIRSLTIEGSESGPIKQPIALQALYSPNNEAILAYNWTVLNPSGQDITAQVLAQDPANREGGYTLFTPAAVGTYTVKLNVITASGITVEAPAKSIIITNKPISLTITGDTKVMAGESMLITVEVTPLGADVTGMKVEIDPADRQYATLTKVNDTQYKLTANLTEKDQVKITAAVGGLTAEHYVDILKLDSISFSAVNKIMYVGDQLQLAPELWFNPRSITLHMVEDHLDWRSSDAAVVSVNNGNDPNAKGIVTALKVGVSKITVQYGPNGPSTDINITVKDRTISDDRY